MNTLLVPLKRSHQLPLGGVPEFNVAVGTARCQYIPVGRECDTEYSLRMAA